MTQLSEKEHNVQMEDMKSFDMKYAAAVQAIKEAIQRSQARALHVVNSEVLSLYYGIGRYISENSRKGFWGTGALAQISGQLQKEMPGLKGYSETSLKDMRTFYEQWQPLVNRQPMADELPAPAATSQSQSGIKIDERMMLSEIRQPVADELDWTDFLREQYRVIVGDEEKFIDLLFFNRQLNALVAVELKDTRFQPAHLGQLSFYLSALDRQVRKPHENPPIGLVLCREFDRMVVEVAISDYTKPMGVATFQLGKNAPEDLTRVLPPAEELGRCIGNSGSTVGQS